MLKNPGLQYPKDLSFESIPSLNEFLAHGGIPGVEYLFLLPKNQPKAQNEGWAQIVGIPFFRIKDMDCTLMARGIPIKNTPAQPGSSKCKVFADTEILDKLDISPVVVVSESVTELEMGAEKKPPQARQTPSPKLTSSSLLK